MAWFRWYEEATSDPKFMVVARRSGHPVAFVVAVWAMLLERANAASERGWITGFDCESADALLGMPDGTSEAILSALRGKGLLDGEDGDHVAKWEDRQPKREDGSAERAKEWRERKKTEANAGERTRTQPNARREEKRKEERENTGGVFNAHPHVASPVPEKPDADIPESSPSQEKTKGTSTPKKTDSPSKGSPKWAEFQSCFAIYPVQQGKEAAWREWMRLDDNGTLAASWEIRDAILTLKAEDTWWQRGKAPKMARWLNEKGWDDRPYSEPVEAARASPRSPRQLTPAQEKQVRMAQNSQDVLKAREALRNAPQNPYRNGIGSNVCTLPPATA